MTQMMMMRLECTASRKSHPVQRTPRLRRKTPDTQVSGYTASRNNVAEMADVA
eukprot:CAMPEP_0170585380 /NCGR_PEP_ID=MMETSP0224-20130122/9181_1 /TAXON_ID=285029 /ORGANISM="Togula jolla, Strain CCCM 725" /LENGTH=52 /DNA_ID=CAMNT_0010908857 /DNA_START=530 /DNA_END=688 /DNA_ORIENTATION=+